MPRQKLLLVSLVSFIIGFSFAAAQENIILAPPQDSFMGSGATNSEGYQLQIFNVPPPVQKPTVVTSTTSPATSTTTTVTPTTTIPVEEPVPTTSTTIVSETTTILPPTSTTISTTAPKETSTTIATTTSTTTSTTTTTTTTTIPEEIKLTPPAPEWIKYGSRTFQPEQSDQIVATPNTKVEIKVNSEAGIDPAGIYAVINEGTPHESTVPIRESSISGLEKIKAKEIKTLTLTYKLPDAADLREGKNTVAIYSKNTFGAVAKLAGFTIVSGPLKLLDAIITHPSPFSPFKDKSLTIQYTLSNHADIDIYIYSVAGEMIKKLSCSAGLEGGSAGLNKVKWNGAMDTGGIIGNGIYMGTLISKKDNELLGKFKITVME